ncbi:Vascular endothelial growth factor like protein [Habropoda laboriosa]|uniref:Vascular endothelial growth factor like protein n=1 Tax=Habropoda laboriosa TaxID=597456 RepID=A0A0L7RDG5_9HYME|nr:Vascular endothelial growth factor like protein [Habropoda laboriosa]
MILDKRLLLLFLVLLMAYGLFVVEARHYGLHEDTANDQRHRHRHRHESSGGKRDRHDLADRRSSSSSSSSSWSGWSQELDYEDDSLPDREDRENGGEDDDYEARPYYERSYPRGSRIAIHGRMFEPRSYPPRYHRGGYRGTSWYDGDEERRRGSPRYTGRSYRLRTHRRPGYARNRDVDYEEDEFDYEKPRSYEEDSAERHRSWWKNGRKHRIGTRYDSPRLDGRKRHRSEDFEPPIRRFDDWRRRSNDSRSVHSKCEGRKKVGNSEDYEYHVDDLEKTDNKEEGEEDDDAWKETEDEDQNEEEDDNDDDDDELDNDFYKTEEKKSPLKTYDDIIRRLTSDDPTTPRPAVRRDYRNIETDRYTKRDAFGYFKYEPKNLSRPVDRGKISSYTNSAMSEHRSPERKLDENLPGKLLGSLINDTQPKTKSLEQDYDEYLNTPDNEKEEDLIKAGVEEDGMQADVTNTDYADDEDETETPATTTTTTTTTSTTTTTTTPRPVVTQAYDFRDPRAYEGGTGSQYNGYQSKNDYPPMSAHSVHKWQSLGTRESVKETRSNMQQYNKNGKTEEIREALLHAIKVLREGSCKWPRPRVISVRDVYPSPSTTYTPHCAILHRCSDDTGCCRSEALTCVPKQSHRVELTFYTTNVGGGNVVEKLSFYNHTECECRERTEYDTSNEKPSEQRFYRHHQSSPQPQNMRRAQPRKPCRCPSEFTPRITSEGECQCNCYENHQNCIKIRRGKGYFSLADRLCIQNEECATPSCEFGDYMRRQGKCPRKKDKFDAIANYHTNLSHRYRS